MVQVKTAVITGVAGQDGSYLAELLLSKNYKILGITRRKSVNAGLDNLTQAVLSNKNFVLIEGDVTDHSFIVGLAAKYQPDEWYNLAAQSNVGQSFKEPLATFDIDAKAVVSQLDAIRTFSKHTKFYQASTSELWGGLPALLKAMMRAWGFTLGLRMG